jgi:PadR family transcriptional regulator PadR
LSSEWGLSDNNRRAKFYELTAAGRHYLSAETDSWARLAAAVTQVLNTT